MAIYVQFKYVDEDFPTWYSIKKFGSKREWAIYKMFINKIKYIEIDIGPVNLSSQNTREIYFHDCFNFFNQKQWLFGNIYEFEWDEWNNFKNIFDEIEDRIMTEMRVDDDTDWNKIFNAILSLDSDIRRFYPCYMECWKYINYFDDHDYSNTYLGILPKPIYDVVRNYEYYHQVEEEISKTNVLFDEMPSYFRYEYAKFELGAINENLRIEIEKYIKNKKEVEKMIDYLEGKIKCAYNRKLFSQRIWVKTRETEVKHFLNRIANRKTIHIDHITFSDPVAILLINCGNFFCRIANRKTI